MKTSEVISGYQLKPLIERIEQLMNAKQDIADDIKEVYSEAKDIGFDTKVMKIVIKLRRMDAYERAEMESITDVYLHALEMIVDSGQDELDRIGGMSTAKSEAMGSAYD